MNFVADEGVDAQIVAHLREAGYDVWYVAEESSGVSDTAVLTLANQKEAILLTADKDFGDLVIRQRLVSQGVVLLRLHGLSPEQKVNVVTAVVRAHANHLPHAFTVITPQKIRIRPLSQLG
jgi:predicted nuclease of predicted toxin-antitoxin system